MSQFPCVREFEFTVRYRRGADRLMDLFIEHPDASAWTPACFATDASTWQVTHLVGPEAAVDRIERTFLDETRCNEPLHAGDCDSTRTYEVLTRRPSHRVIYARRTEVEGCHSVPYLAAEHVGDGLLFEARRREDEYRWTVLVPGERGVGTLFDAVSSGLREGLTLDLRRVSGLREWSVRSFPGLDLPHAQRAALVAAVERGYYATPRRATVADLSEALDVPRSTLQYRLQRAEERVMGQVVETMPL
ncbi:MAG: helix-turn-helix domain-containing protein [Haloferacaceae archaeon]